MRAITAGKSASAPAGTFTPKRSAARMSAADAGGANNGFRGHAAIIKAVAAHQMPLHQGHPGSQARGPGGGDQSGGAGADDHQVVTGAGSGFFQSTGWALASKASLYLSQGLSSGMSILLSGKSLANAGYRG